MPSYTIFALADELQDSPLGTLSVDKAGAVTANIDMASPLAGKLRAALDDIRKAESLTLRTEETTEENGQLRRKYLAEPVKPGDPGYASAVADALGFAGFECEFDG